MKLAVMAALVVAIGCGGKQAPPSEPIGNTVAADPNAKPAPSNNCELEGETAAMMNMMCTYVRRVCACKDMDCLTRAGEDYAKRAAEWAKDNAHKTASEATDEEKVRVERLVTEMTVCTKKIVDEAAARGGAGSGGAP